MTQPLSIQRYFLRSALRFTVIGLAFLVSVSLVVSFFLARKQMSTDLQETALATAKGFHDRILDGDIRSVEPQIKQLLKIKSDESAEILKSDWSRAYDGFAKTEDIKPCPTVGQTCFDGWLGQARIFAPVEMGSGPAKYYVYVSKNIDLNWNFLITVLAVLVIGFVGLMLIFYRVSAATSAELGEALLNWSNRLKENPKDTAPVAAPPFAELMPLRQAIEGLNSQIEKFEQTATDKARLLLLRGIAHDILSPVSRLQRYIGILSDNPDQAIHAGIISDIEDSLLSVTGIAEQVKTLNDLDLPSEATELASATEQTVHALRDLTAVTKKSIQLGFSSSASNVISPFSRTEITRIIANLVENAADASAVGSAVHVTVGKDFLSVVDRGSGIPEYARDRIFDPNFTLKPGTGTGLGLAVVKYICDRRAAAIELDTKVNAGTTVTIRLPQTGGVHA